MLGKKSLSPQVSDWVIKEAEVKILQNSKFIFFFEKKLCCKNE